MTAAVIPTVFTVISAAVAIPPPNLRALPAMYPFLQVDRICRWAANTDLIVDDNGTEAKLFLRKTCWFSDVSDRMDNGDMLAMYRP